MKFSLCPIFLLLFGFMPLLSLAQDALPKRLTNVRDTYPALSPDGTKIAFGSNRTGDAEIFIMNRDGTQIHQLTYNPGFDGCPQWSPDGQRIVFASERDRGDSEIYLMAADGQQQTRLTFTPGDDSHPHWSPDGKRIIFNSARTTPDLTVPWSQQYLELFDMKADGSDVRQITQGKTISTYPSYSPDGKHIAFRRVTDDMGFQWDLTTGKRNSEIFVANADGSNPVNLSNNAAFDGWPCWSPDGRQLVFASNRNGPANTGQLFIIQTDGKNLRQFTFGPGGFVQPSWSANGQSILAYQCWETPDYEYGNIVLVPLPIDSK